MPVFAFPLALIGLLAVPALIAIYVLRSRARRQRVSSLLLWLDERQMWEGGQRIYRLQTPLLFFLELLIILLIVTAAAGPMMRAGEGGRPLVIVLDDSFSMLAGNDESARNRAVRAIDNELRSGRYDPVRFVLAGETPQVLGEATGKAEHAIDWLKDWKCAAPMSKLEEAIAFAFELSRSRTRVLAVTDHAPQQELTNSRLQWWAFGSSQQNVAFVNATRTSRDDVDRVLIEIANLSSQPGSTTLTIESNSPSDAAKPQLTPGTQNWPQSISLGANETRRLVLTFKAGAPPLHARLRDDALNVDNKIVLMPEANKMVRIDLRLNDAAVRAIVEKSLQSSQIVTITPDKPELLITDVAEAATEGTEAWTLKLIPEKDAASFLGPFIIDRAHPMSEGLSLGGVVWGGGKSAQFPGSPIITAGNIPLLTDIERAGKHELRMRLRPDLSTLQETPSWPILMWNLINWRAGAAPGLQQANVRLGSGAALKVETEVESVKVTDPAGITKQFPVRDKAVTIIADKIGIYEVTTNQGKYSFAANALQREESDLTRAASGRWGNWAKAADLQWEYRNMAWLLLLLAMMTLAVHAWLVAHR
ncbi:MAG: BatA domain-containing protein [Acidobacteria bacterium]|nr:BatA domain-containing protein [Acidobacteriota bacterium]